MQSTIQLTAVLVGGLLGALLMIVTLFSNRWRAHEKNRENRYLLSFMWITLISCVVDPLSFYMDGKPGGPAYFIVYTGNWWSFLAVLMLTAGWIFFLSSFLDARISKFHTWLLIGLFAAGILMLLINSGDPIIFYVDSNNVYHRGRLFWLLECMQVFFLADSVFIYETTRRKGGVLKFFPVNIFMLPLVVGAALQTVFYGISTIWPCTAIAISGISASLQNQLIFRDKLTGLFNRFYLDNLKQQIRRFDRARFTVMMLDLNDFKSINDTFGHSVGDDALIQTSKILRHVVGKVGSVIRYAGDEFLILLNTQDNVIVDGYVSAIRREMEAFNDSGFAGYKLSTSIGTAKLDLSIHTIDELMNQVDAQMFIDKRAYHDAHPGTGRYKH